MNPLFISHAVIVSIGVVLSTLNLITSWEDLRVVRSNKVEGVLEIIAKSWVVREFIHLLIQLTFLSFIVLLVLNGDLTRIPDQKVLLLEMRAVWISGFVALLSLWDWGIRLKLRKL